MKIEGMLFACGTVFYAVVAVIYFLLSREPVGTTALALTAGLAFLVGFYVLFTGRRVGERPEDRIDAEIEEGAGELGFFSPHSWWPLYVAVGAAVTTLGLTFGFWLSYIGVTILGLSIIGLVFEYYRGEHAH
ncbi:cytochrome c oxidase subunit 4 [Vallicoccus soli]|uniref:Cytochrome c oxidase polypeptide 4 n=1 Tax=Vallicoccus soli TaxID=2339232 RepID=A0A3A3Z2I6_9ACTN|nr:cytochrome c oxidase subunit 4 [Vallicoccus soli]RJK96899.1 cytochrome c oxidase subunit 4 [Vallicoccus soli]